METHKRKITLFVLGTMFMAASCDKPDGSTIIYIDLNDQEMYYNKPVDVDINSDSLVDFTFSSIFIGHETATSQMFTVYPQRNNKVFFESNIPAFEKGHTIYPDLPSPAWWSQFGGDLAADAIEPDYGWHGPWAGVSNRYLAIQLQRQDTLFNYGWIRMSLDTATHKLIVHDAAYESKPDYRIDTGDR